MPSECAIDHCVKPRRARGWCGTHYSQWQRTGDPLGTTRPSLAERFWRRVDVGGPDDCWVWQGATVRGYGRVWVGGAVVNAHRVAYELLVGPIAPGRQIDHLCRVRSCVNPRHLEPVTPRENLMRGEAPTMRAARTDTCGRGLHPLSGENLYVTPDGARRCRTCVRERTRMAHAV